MNTNVEFQNQQRSKFVQPESKEVILDWFNKRNNPVETEVAKELSPNEEKERQELAALIKENS